MITHDLQNIFVIILILIYYKIKSLIMSVLCVYVDRAYNPEMPSQYHMYGLRVVYAKNV